MSWTAATLLVAPWLILGGYGLAVLLSTPRRAGPTGFFGGRGHDGATPGIILLGASAAISWVMAKSVNNAMNLAADFGWIGGIGYAAYWLAFVVVAVAVYVMRTRGGFTSLAGFLKTKYGTRAARLFLLVIAIRLINEVWSNTKIAALYFGAEGSSGYWIAAAGLTLFTLYYSLKGGLRSSIVTDGLQMILLLFLLVVTLGLLAPDVLRLGIPSVASGDVTPAMQAGGLTFLGLALVQTLSYGFHDPVMTDRAFVNAPGKMVASFVLAALLGGALIVGFSSAGLYALAHDIAPSPSVAVAVPLAVGLGMTLLFNAVMLAAAGSTLDSVMTATAKFGARDWPHADGPPTVYQQATGRRAMWAIAILGNLPLLSIYIDGVGPAVIAATTISGTAIMGLAPIFLLGWIKRAGRLSFHLALWPGVIIGVLLALEDILHLPTIPSFVGIGVGPYAETLGINVYGVLLCSVLFVAGARIRPRRGLL
ncbi:Na+/proline symporter [uncultured Salinisphaera sp.]|uniref:Na+/proline symporter n=1 Tax=uncultured Salinisphaera sp. TaxID=359372 RepID=UPI0032B117B8|tara:strand:- start:7954 stop:9393 length:1440 start_codon:yes stop_codon:yes gene_type:complete